MSLLGVPCLVDAQIGYKKQNQSGACTNAAVQPSKMPSSDSSQSQTMAVPESSIMSPPLTAGQKSTARAKAAQLYQGKLETTLLACKTIQNRLLESPNDSSDSSKSETAYIPVRTAFQTHSLAVNRRAASSGMTLGAAMASRIEALARARESTNRK